MIAVNLKLISQGGNNATLSIIAADATVSCAGYDSAGVSGARMQPAPFAAYGSVRIMLGSTTLNSATAIGRNRQPINKQNLIK